jgi:PAS domain S-box-containing protein
MVSVILFVGYYYPAQQKIFYQNSKQTEIRELAETVALGVELSLNSDDFFGLKKTIDFASEKQEFEFVAVIAEDSLSGDANILASFPADIDSKRITQRDTVKYFYSEAPFQTETLSGRIVVCYANEKLDELINKEQQPIYLALGIFMVISLLAFYLFAKRLSKPIYQLKVLTNQLSEGNYDLNSHIKISKDEVGDLSKSVLELQSKLIEARNRNKQLTDGLEEEIRIRTEELEKLSLVAKSTTNCVIITDADKKIQWVNDSVLKLTGYSSNEIIGRTPSMFQFEKTNPVVTDFIREKLEKHEALVNVEVLNRGKFGNEYWLALNIVPLFNADNEVYGYIAIENDITEKKKYEEEQELLFNLTNNQNLRLKNFAHIVSHNLRSHSANIQVLTGIIASKYGDSIQDEVINMLSKSSSNLLETVDHLSEVALMITNKQGTLEVIQLKSVLVKTIDSVRALASNNNVLIELDSIDEHEAILGIQAYVDSVLLNLLTNAIKYSDSNKQQSTIHIKTEVSTEYVHVSFIDNGLGIDLEKHGRKMFGMYKTFHEHKDSRGIGLFMIKNQIEAIGGKIEVESIEGIGSTFTASFKNGSE